MCNLEYFGSTVSLQWMEMFRNRWLAPLISYPKWKKVTENLKWIGKILHSAWPNNTAYTCAIWSTLAEQGTCGERNARNLLRAGLRSTAQVSGFTFYYGTESRFYGKLQKRPPDVILRIVTFTIKKTTSTLQYLLQLLWVVMFPTLDPTCNFFMQILQNTSPVSM